MKKLISISALTLLFFGCTPSDDSQDTSNDCNCGVITYVRYITLPSGQTSTTIKVRNNCTDNVSTIGLSGHIGAVGQQYCNN